MVPLLKPARYKGAHGGRDSGKSHGIAEYIIERHIISKTDTVCIREVQSSLKLSVKRLLESKIQKFGVGHLFEVRDKFIRAPHGGLITFTGMSDQTAESIKSLEDFDISWFEEAQACSQRSLDLLRPTMRKPGAELLFSWNPKNATDPVDVLLRSEHSPSLPGGSIVVETNYRDNPWLTDEMQAEAEYDRARDPDKFAHIWLGQYLRNSEARVFKNWTVEEVEAPPGVTFRYGLDFGFAVDPSAAGRCWVDGRNLYIDYEAHGMNVEIADLPEFLMQIPEAEKWPMVADSSRPETISHLRKNGFPKIMSAIKGPGSVEDGVEFLKSFNIKVHPRCRHVIDELTLYSYKVDKATDKVLPVLVDKDNHHIDWMRYALEGVRRIASVKPIAKPRERVRMPGGFFGG
jgi:phage terminase large subunit